MPKFFKARKVWQSAAFNITSISAFLSYGAIALVLIGLVNNGTTNFNWPLTLLILAITLLVLLGTMVGLALLMRNNPSLVRFDENKLTVDGAKGREAEISFADIIQVRKSEVPVKYWILPISASFAAMLIRYKDPITQQEAQYTVSSLNTNNFDGVIAQLRLIAPAPARKQRPEQMVQEPEASAVENQNQNNQPEVDKDMDEYQRCKNALKGQTELILAMVAPLDTAQWYKPSKLAGWDILTLVAHIVRATENLVKYAAEPSDEPAKVDRVSYWHFDGRGVAEGISQRAVEDAAQTSPEALPLEFERSLKTALAVLDNVPASTVIKSRLAPITLVEFTATRILELTIHGLDLALALEEPPRFDPAAQAITVEILEALIKQPRPTELADDIVFIGAAAGRVPYPGLEISAFS